MVRALALSVFLLLCFGLCTITADPDCSSLLGSSGRKRMIFDHIASAFNNLPQEVKDILPGHPEVDSRCRFDLTSLTQSQTQTLKSLYHQGYSLCVGCSQTDSDHDKCHAIEVCRKGTSCIQGYNEHRIPSYYWHGCCETTDPHCKSGSFNVHVSHWPLTYKKIVCKGPLCNENAYTNEKASLINQLVGATQTTPLATQAPLNQTPAGPVDGGFSSWSAWGSCDKSCDIGVRLRTRTCSNPAPSNGGANCVGHTTDTELCNVNACSK